MNKIEEEFFKAFEIGIPVMLKWCYDGYYEDFSWQSSEEDCTELLKYFGNSVEKLNDRIQELKKDREANKYDISTDSVSTEFGRVSGAYVRYPKITAEILLELICILINSKSPITFERGSKPANVSAMKGLVLKGCIRHVDDIKYQVQALFKGDARQ